MITERRVLSFKASQLLKHALNDEASMAAPRKWVGTETWDKPAGGLDLRTAKDAEPSPAGGGSGGT